MHLNIKYGLVVGIAEITRETGKISHLSANFHFPRSLKFLWPSSSNPLVSHSIDVVVESQNLLFHL